MLGAVDLPDECLAAHLVKPSLDLHLDLLPLAVDSLPFFPGAASPEIGACVRRFPLLDVLHAHDDQLVLPGIAVLDVAEASDNLSPVEGVCDLEIVPFHVVVAPPLVGSEIVALVDQLDGYGSRWLKRVFLRDVLDTVVPEHQVHVILVGLVVEVGDRRDEVRLHRVKAEPCVVDDIQSKVCHIDVCPGDRDFVVIFVVIVPFVLADALRFCCLERPVHPDEVSLDELPLVIRDLELPDAPGEFLENLVHEALAHVRLRNRCGLCRLCACLGHFVFLLSMFHSYGSTP